MKSNHWYKHRNCTDTAIYVTKSFYVKEIEVINISFKWFNIVNPKNPYDMGLEDTATIAISDFHQNWEHYYV
jgi:hypothetical protein